ncbi:catalase-related domain-containing protein [Salipaludibacillus sp. CF4.18]|uniref:catalase-related domain-containing protein n=1 Tax=Salipaludibacillus sp. CF4.18 TaxID=3373081 RepID=UPI003EE6EDE0
MESNIVALNTIIYPNSQLADIHNSDYRRHTADHMRDVERDEIKLRQIALFYKVDPELGSGVAANLGLAVPESAK